MARGSRLNHCAVTEAREPAQSQAGRQKKARDWVGSTWGRAGPAQPSRAGDRRMLRAIAAPPPRVR
jgi:hypothetical protein